MPRCGPPPGLPPVCPQSSPGLPSVCPPNHTGDNLCPAAQAAGEDRVGGDTSVGAGNDSERTGGEVGRHRGAAHSGTEVILSQSVRNRLVPKVISPSLPLPLSHSPSTLNFLSHSHPSPPPLLLNHFLLPPPPSLPLNHSLPQTSPIPQRRTLSPPIAPNCFVSKEESPYVLLKSTEAPRTSPLKPEGQVTSPSR